MGIFDFLFPKHCVGCGKNGTYFCQDCVERAKPAFPLVCPVCERASIDGITHTKCKSRVSPEGLFSVWEYTGVPRKLIVQLKYKFVEEAAYDLAHGVFPELSKSYPSWLKGQNTLVPIPLYWKRENWRGFNQVKSAGELIVEQMGWEFKEILIRTKNTKHQVGLKGRQRQENVQGIFSLASNITIKQFNKIILFDDVWTTGSTLKEAAKTLKQAGVGQVWCLTLAR
ncbi:MAG: ComF family protein [Candidatus Blackburnbacteria bacterium]|nr:ComF family protein [Candidatus Blackburnbacteria bacterium]